ncbi:2-methylcitrate synthase [hydrothermal vent metagenome]|uniref:citrate synthase (unknown stereospecificity) n=1 Tax=hydrothermal vent metagenome TaxID=652676 RepID=A0A3B0ZG44_9ZZZZ
MKKRTQGGLASVIAGESSICTVGVAGKGLNYRGYSILDLARFSNYEEVAYLILYGELPNQVQLKSYQETLVKKRTLPATLKEILVRLPKSTSPMDVLRTGISALGCIEPETEYSNHYELADRLIAVMPNILMFWYLQSHYGREPDTNRFDYNTMASFILGALKGEEATEEEIKALDVSLILYAEHEFNASTFAARVTASTLSDFYSTITTAIGTLRGSLHGGANEAAMLLVRRMDEVTDVEQEIKNALSRKEKIMGFGHRVYSERDPRNEVIKSCSSRLSKGHPNERFYALSEQIEATMWQEKKLFPNLDFYSATAYYYMGIDIALYTPLFVCSRMVGWAAHVIEQRENNALIRPAAQYIGYAERDYISLEKRN